MLNNQLAYEASRAHVAQMTHRCVNGESHPPLEV